MTPQQAEADSLDAQTFTVAAANQPRNGKLPEDELTIDVVDDEPSLSNAIDVTITLHGRDIPGTFEPQYPTTGVGTRDEGRYTVTFDTPLGQYTDMLGDYIMGLATGVVIPNDVGDRICDHFGMDTLSDRASEVSDHSFKSELRARLEHGDDDFRDEVETILDRTE